MRIAHVISYLDDRYGGPPTAIRKTSNELKRLGIDVTIFSTRRPADDIVNCSLRHFESNTDWPHSWRYSHEFAKEFNQQVNNFDVVHIHEVWHYIQLAAANAAIRHKVPYVFTPRASLEPWRMRYKGWKKYLYFMLFGKRIMSHAACMHAVADAETDGFHRLGFRGTSIVVNNGIDPDEFSVMPGPEEAEQFWPAMKNKRVVLFLSRISPEKGIDQLIPAWEAISKNDKYADTLLVLAGPDDRGYRKHVQEQLGQLNLSGRVLLTGMVTGKDKLALISRADIYVLPSYSEGFSNSILENLAASKPVLITPGCNFPEVVAAGAGFCVEPHRDNLMNGLERLLDMPKDELEAMGKRGRTMVMENYTWEIAARKLITVYQAILKGDKIPEHPEPIPIGPDGKARLNS